MIQNTKFYSASFLPTTASIYLSLSGFKLMRRELFYIKYKFLGADVSARQS
jgi:hypothetical protein